MDNLRDYHRATVKKLFQRICEERSRANDFQRKMVDSTDTPEQKNSTSHAAENKS